MVVFSHYQELVGKTIKEVLVSRGGDYGVQEDENA